MEGDQGDDVVSADDVAALNRAAVDRSAVLARITGAGLVVVGAIAALGWLWTAIRTQQQLDDGVWVGFDGSDEVDAKVRLDQLTSGIGSLAVAAGVIGLGAGVRLLADYAQARVGGSITGFQVGDRFTDGDDESDELVLQPEA